MIEFLVSWAEQLIIALMIIIIIEMIIPNSSYRKYIKVVLGIFILYVVFNPIIKNKLTDIDIKKISNQIEINNITQISGSGIDYTKQIENAYKEKFKENITNTLIEKGYEIKNIELDVNYENENIITNKLRLKISKMPKSTSITIEKVEISEAQENINSEELEKLKTEIGNTYNIEISKIFIESEKKNG